MDLSLRQNRICVRLQHRQAFSKEVMKASLQSLHLKDAAITFVGEEENEEEGDAETRENAEELLPVLCVQNIRDILFDDVWKGKVVASAFPLRRSFCSKEGLARLVEKARRGKAAVPSVPPSLILQKDSHDDNLESEEEEIDEFWKDCETFFCENTSLSSSQTELPKVVWKTDDRNRAEGISFHADRASLNAALSSAAAGSYVAQAFVPSSLLHCRSRTTVRTYLTLTCSDADRDGVAADGTVVVKGYLLPENVVLFAKDEEEKGGRTAYLTNHVLRRGETEKVQYCSLKSLLTETATTECAVDYDRVIAAMETTLRSLLESAARDFFGFFPLRGSFDTFGADWIVTPEGKVYLLEMNSDPSYRMFDGERRADCVRLHKRVFAAVLRDLYRVDAEEGCLAQPFATVQMKRTQRQFQTVQKSSSLLTRLALADKEGDGERDETGGFHVAIPVPSLYEAAVAARESLLDQLRSSFSNEKEQQKGAITLSLSDSFRRPVFFNAILCEKADTPWDLILKTSEQRPTVGVGFVSKILLPSAVALFQKQQRKYNEKMRFAPLPSAYSDSALSAATEAIGVSPVEIVQIDNNGFKRLMTEEARQAKETAGNASDDRPSGDRRSWTVAAGQTDSVLFVTGFLHKGGCSIIQSEPTSASLDILQQIEEALQAMVSFERVIPPANVLPFCAGFLLDQSPQAKQTSIDCFFVEEISLQTMRAFASDVHIVKGFLKAVIHTR